MVPARRRERIAAMQLSRTSIWRYFGRLEWGLVLSLELAAAGIAAGIVIGLALALLAHGRGRIVRGLIAAYVEFIRNVPLLLLVYLVFYGIPSVGGFAYDATTSFIITLAVYAGAYLVEVFRAGLDAIPRGLIDAGRAIGLTPWQRTLYVQAADHAAHRAAVAVERLHLAVQGHRHRLGDRGAGAHLRRQLDLHQHLPHHRGLRRGHADVPGHGLDVLLFAAPGGASLRAAPHR